MTTSLTAPALARIIEDTESIELPVYKRLPIAIEGGRGCRVFDSEGREYLDLYAGHAVALAGHAHPRIAAAIRDQAERLLFYSSAAYGAVRARAGAALMRRAPVPGSRLFHAVSGSEANEVAIKAARRATGRRKILAFEGGFHGRTLGALSLCGMRKYRATAFARLDPDVSHLPFASLDALSAIDGDTAAVIIEPIQSLQGARAAPDAFLQALRERTRQAGAALIFDEVQTGLGRCGSFFYGDGIGVAPDIITLAKGLASGVPSSAVILAPGFADAAPGEQGSTFGGGPLAMAALVANLAIIEDEDLVTNAAARGRQLEEGLEAMPQVAEVRGRGLLIGVRADRPARAVQSALLARGIIAGTSADPEVLRLLPPLTLSAQDCQLFLDVLAAVLAEPSPKEAL